MPKIVSLGCTGQLAILILLYGLFASSVMASCPAETEKDVVWRRMLAASLEGTDAALVRVRSTEASTEYPEVQQLARVVLEEWNLPEDAKVLSKPRLVYTPQLDDSVVKEFELGENISSMVVVTGTVDTSGLLEELEIRVGSGSELYDKYCLSLLRTWRYRPARGESGYVRAKVGATCTLHPK